jgi:hypothetical protein
VTEAAAVPGAGEPDGRRPGGLAVVIPAKDEAERIVRTVRAALSIDGRSR